MSDPRDLPAERPADKIPLYRILFDAMVRLLTARNLRSDRFGTMAAIIGVALGTATVNVVLVLDVNTQRTENRAWITNPDMPVEKGTVAIHGARKGGARVQARDVKVETHEDYQVMRSAIRLGSLSAFLVGALIVFFTFGVIVDKRRREAALLRSLGAQPRQVAAVFVREAVIIGLVGAALGLLLAIPMAYLAARAGITTTGRSRIVLRALRYPWGAMLRISIIGAFMAVLGVLRPARDMLRLKVSEALRPRFLEQQGASMTAKRTSGITLVAIPFMLLVYILLRPFFKNALPSLTFFVLEAGLVCAASLVTILLVPELVRRLGAKLVLLYPRGPAAERLLTQRRIEHTGHELGWAVSGIMLVFALLLSLHISTHALKQEVVTWAAGAIRDRAFLMPVNPYRLHAGLLGRLRPAASASAGKALAPQPSAVTPPHPSAAPEPSTAVPESSNAVPAPLAPPASASAAPAPSNAVLAPPAPSGAPSAAPDDPWASAIPRAVMVDDQIEKDARLPLPARYAQAQFTGRTPWPNAVHAVPGRQLVEVAEALGRPELVAIAKRLGPGKIILSKMMARRYRVGEGDVLVIEGKGGTRTMEVVGVTDDIGYTPMVGPYRNSKTYGLIDHADWRLISPYVSPLGTVTMVVDRENPSGAKDFHVLGQSLPRDHQTQLLRGDFFEQDRVSETGRDFLIFDIILALTSLLAAVGVANQMVLSVRSRTREIALYRVLGMTSSQVRRLVVMEGGFIGLLGGGLAALLGVPLGYAAIGALKAVSAFEVEFDLPSRM
jgi:ABC-type antimicrobial peptide transport system permease subunit